MTVGEIFIKIGLAGAGKVKDGLSSVHSTLKGVRDTSFEVKAGIFGAVVALEEITRRAVLAAVELKNFSGATGLSTEWLQKWGYWAEINGVKADNLAQTIKGLQNAQAALALGEGVPAGAIYFGLNQNNNPEEMFSEIQKKLRSLGGDQKKIGMARHMAATLGITDDMFAALRIGTVGFAGFRKEMMLTARDQKSLIGLGHEWTKFFETLKGTTNKAVAKDLTGPIVEFLHVFRNAVVEVAELTDKFNKAVGHLAKGDQKKLKTAFEGLALAVTAAFAPMGPYIVALVALAGALDTIYKYTHGEKSLLGDPALDKAKLQTYRDASKIGGTSADIAKNKDQFGGGAVATGLSAIAKLGEWITGPQKNAAAGVGAKGETNVNLRVTNYITEAADAKEVADEFQRSVNTAVFQNPALNSLVGPPAPKGGQ